MIHLKTRATRNDATERLSWKVRMIRHLYSRGFERTNVESLFRFIDWLMILPEELEERFEFELRQLEGETEMPYVTRFERRAMERGAVQGLVSMLKRQLTRRFEKLPSWVEERLENASRDELENWVERVIDADSLEQVFAAS